MPTTRLLVLFYYGTFAVVMAVTHLKGFFEDDNLRGFTCPTEQIDFVQKIEGSLAKCLSKCSRASTCYGVFRYVGDKRCVGCKHKFLTNANAPSLTGTEYYRRRVYKPVTKLMIWSDAKSHCEDLGGYLADIKSQEEEYFIYNNVISDFTLVWAGATNWQIRTSFLWQDGTKVSDGYSSWFPGEPDYGYNSCLILVYTNMAWSWNDNRCTHLLSSLCKFD